jgi:hypothetical protein
MRRLVHVISERLVHDLSLEGSPRAQAVQIADREDGISAKPAAAAAKGADPDLEAENRELRRRTKQLEQENEILCWGVARHCVRGR